MKKNKFNISLPHININLDINNKKDVEGLDRVLHLFIENQHSVPKLIELVKHTSFKYLERLDEDGLFMDKGGSGVLPIYEPVVTNKAIEFMKVGGYSALYKEPKKKRDRSFLREIIIMVIGGIILWLIVQYILLPLFTK